MRLESEVVGHYSLYARGDHHKQRLMKEENTEMNRTVSVGLREPCVFGITLSTISELSIRYRFTCQLLTVLPTDAANPS